MHFLVSRLELGGFRMRVEDVVLDAGFADELLRIGDRMRLGEQAHGSAHIGIAVRVDELAQPGRVQEAAADPRGEIGALHRHYRYAGEYRVRRAGVPAIGPGIEHDVATLHARRVSLLRELGREEQAPGVHSRRRSGAHEILAGRGPGIQNPEDHSGRGLEDLHPGRPDLGADLVDVVEHARHDRIRRQADGLARRHRRQCALGVVVDLVRALNADQLLRIRCARGIRHDVRVCDHIIDKAPARRAGKPEICDLHGRRAPGEDPHPGTFGQAVQVHQDVDPVIRDHPGGHLVVDAAQQADLVEVRKHLAPHRRAVIPARAVRGQLEPLAVVVAHQAAHQP